MPANLSLSAREVIRALDGVEVGVLLYAGEEVHSQVYSSRTFRLWLQEEAQRERLQAEIDSLIEEVRSEGGRSGSDGRRSREPKLREWQTSKAVYRLHAKRVAATGDDSSAAVLVTVERAAPEPLADESLIERFGLSPRESEIMRLLAAGKAKPAIAEELEISPYTVNHHTERIMLKLGVHSRAEALAKVLWG